MKQLVRLLMIALLAASGILPNAACFERSEVREHLKNLDMGQPFNYRNLTIVPIYVRNAQDTTNYVTLDEALRRNYIQITELDGGRVPQVRITNKSRHYILLVAGEILTGGKQDRLVGRDVLLGPKIKNVIIPVYCSEQGRWEAQTDFFFSEKNNAEPMLRGLIYGRKTQGSIWKRITEYSDELDVTSGTSALQDVYRDKKVAKSMEEYVDNLQHLPRLEEDAVGVVVGLGGEIIGIDIFSSGQAFAKLWPKLLRSYVALAVSKNGAYGRITQDQVKRILNRISRADFSAQPGLGLGEELQAEDSGMVTSALLYGRNVVHLAVFPVNGEFSPHASDQRIPVIE